ncbi:MAG: hypothetical protein CMH83_10970 [Nocardioides sp.]|nr:hypothetical protein [Nocardioides sp.]
MADQDKERPSLEPPTLFGRRKDRAPKTPRPKRAKAPESTSAPEQTPEAPGTAPVEAPVASPAAARTPEAPEPVEVEAESPASRDTVVLEKDEPTAVFEDAGSEPGATTVGDVGDDDAPADDRPAAYATPGLGARLGGLLPDAARGGGLVAAGVTGLLVGLLLVAVAGGGFGACRAASGGQCGSGTSTGLLVVTFLLAVVAGRVLLEALGVGDPVATSFLAVASTTIVLLLFLVDALGSWTMLVVVPVVTIACFAASWWLTTSFTEDDPL